MQEEDIEVMTLVAKFVDPDLMDMVTRAAEVLSLFEIPDLEEGVERLFENIENEEINAVSDRVKEHFNQCLRNTLLKQGIILNDETTWVDALRVCEALVDLISPADAGSIVQIIDIGASPEETMSACLAQFSNKSEDYFIEVLSFVNGDAVSKLRQLYIELVNGDEEDTNPVIEAAVLDILHRLRNIDNTALYDRFRFRSAGGSFESYLIEFDEKSDARWVAWNLIVAQLYHTGTTEGFSVAVKQRWAEMAGRYPLDFTTKVDLKLNDLFKELSQ